MIYDLAIVGGGPAGAAAGVYAARKQLRTIIITKDWLGQSVDSEKIENWIGTPAISGLQLSKSLEAHVKTYAANIIDFKEGALCEGITKAASNSGNGNSAMQIFDIKTPNETFQAKTVLIATGSRRRKLDVPGAKEFENKGLTYCATCDGPLYGGMDTVVIGGGNAGFEAAAQLLAYCKSVTLLIRGGEFKADPGTIEAVLANPKMTAIKYAIPKKISGNKFVESITYEDVNTHTEKTLNVNGIFVEIGSLPNTGMVKGLVEIDNFDKVVVNAKNQRTSEEGIWAAGDCTDGLFHQNNIAAGDAVKAIEDIYSFVSKLK